MLHHFDRLARPTLHLLGEFPQRLKAVPRPALRAAEPALMVGAASQQLAQTQA